MRQAQEMRLTVNRHSLPSGSKPPKSPSLTFGETWHYATDVLEQIPFSFPIRATMRLSLGQQMQMAQKQVLAPRMIQSMEILQLPIIALQERIEQEMEDNPVLDQIEPTEETEYTREEQVSPDAPAEAERELVVKDDANNEDDFERLMNMADNLPDDYEEQSRPSRGQMEAEADRRHDAMANMVSRPESLHDYLHHQLTWYDLGDDSRRMCERVIYNLDSNGYLKSPLDDLLLPPPSDVNGDADSWRVEQLKLAEEALGIIQQLDPPGVGARNLKECLLLQLTPGFALLRRTSGPHRESPRRSRK